MSDHSVKVIRITEVLPHKNADKLEIVPIGGYQVVIGKGNFKAGNLAVYIPPDSIVPAREEYSFIWERDGGGNLREVLPLDQVPEKYRRVTVRRLRKEWSEGLLMQFDTLVPEEGFNFGSGVHCMPQEGADVAAYLGITHWNPPEDIDLEGAPTRSIRQSKIWPRSLKGWAYFLSYWLSFGLYNPWGNLGGSNEKAPMNTPPIYDVEAFKNYKDVFYLKDGEHLVVTEKIHGSNARYVYESGILGGRFYAGSRKLWKRAGNSIWRQAAKENPDIEKWCRDYPGYTLYGEVVPTQKGFDYGVPEGKAEVFFFDIRTPDGEWMSYRDARVITEQYSLLKWAPCLLQDRPESEQEVVNYADGQTLTPGKHIREGVVVRIQPERVIRGLGRAQVKIVSNDYYNLTKE